MAKLIILDLMGTVVKMDESDGVVRPGLDEFLEHYRSSRKVIFTDGRPHVVEAILQIAGLSDRFDTVYDARHCVPENAYGMSKGQFRDILMNRGGGKIKNLEKACADFSVPKPDAVFIGDNYHGHDQKSAELHEVRFIKVPQFRERLPDDEMQDMERNNVEYEDPAKPFSFASLIGDL